MEKCMITFKRKKEKKI